METTMTGPRPICTECKKSIRPREDLEVDGGVFFCDFCPDEHLNDVEREIRRGGVEA